MGSSLSVSSRHHRPARPDFVWLSSRFVGFSWVGFGVRFRFVAGVRGACEVQVRDLTDSFFRDE